MVTLIENKFLYKPGVTTAASPITDMLQHGSGVCQDFTHLMIGMARALGETAPLLLVGAAAAGFGQAASATLVERIFGPYTALPTTIYSWARLPQEEFKALTAAAIVVLLAVVLLINAIAIILRNRYERRW